MYKHACTCTCTYWYTCTCTYWYTVHVHTGVLVHVHTGILVHVHTGVLVHVHTGILVHVHTGILVHVHTGILVHVHTGIPVHVYSTPNLYILHLTCAQAMATGAIEVELESLDVLNEASHLPFSVSTPHTEVHVFAYLVWERNLESFCVAEM